MKTILITGGGSGLGLELTKQYCQDNQVLIIGRNEQKLKAAIKSIPSFKNIDYFVCDITSSKDIESLKTHIINKYTTIETLINNAGLGFFGPLVDLTLDELNSMLDINVKGTILMTQHLMPIINSKIINIISTAGLRGKVNEAAYVASKFAVRGFTESLQKEYENKKVITAVYMGGMATPFWNDSTHIKDMSRLKDPSTVAKEIYTKDDGRAKIIID